jgi:ribulose 1,5-bisphosphate carboxylase large subunit-like protein
MSIKVHYGKFRVREGVDPAEIKKLMARDASWGTHIGDLQAAKATCGDDAQETWKKAEPIITNLVDGLPKDESFSLTFPSANFNLTSESIDHFVGVVAGDIVLNPDIDSIEVRDFEFLNDDGLYNSFPGPNVGVDQLYNELLKPTLGKDKRPIVAFTVKPRLGLSIGDYKKIFEHAAVSGIDIIEDDERLIDPVSCPFADRVNEISKLQKKYTSIYSVNITADSESALAKLDHCAAQGIKMVKLDVLAAGFETLRKIARRIRDKYASAIAITVYPDAIGAYRKLGREFILRLARMCGADIIYAGSPNWARYEKANAKFKEAIEPVYQRHRLLSDGFAGAPQIKSTLATITNDQHLSRSELLIAYLRKHKNDHYRYGFFVGGGISGFPSDIKTAVQEWMNCVRHASSQNLNPYKPYDLAKYDAALNAIGWRRLDIQKALSDE